MSVSEGSSVMLKPVCVDYIVKLAPHSSSLTDKTWTEGETVLTKSLSLIKPITDLQVTLT